MKTNVCLPGHVILIYTALPHIDIDPTWLVHICTTTTIVVVAFQLIVLANFQFSSILVSNFQVPIYCVL